MKEAFLHYVWQYQQFQQQPQTTTVGDELLIINPGVHNTNAGPDFLEAKLKIGRIEWSGAVEIHINSSDWYQHKHHHDPTYQNVILHVVWEDNRAVTYSDGRKIPTLILKNKVTLELVNHYESLIANKEDIACAASWRTVNAFTVFQMLELSLVERLQEKSEKAACFYEHSKNDWEATTYFMILSAFGFKVNTYAFERLAYLLPYELVRKYKSQSEALLALFFGVAGFLEDELKGDLKNKMKQEWQYLRHKHGLKTIVAKHEWNFLRLRPANFPTVRLAQAAYFMVSVDSLFDHFVNRIDVGALKKSLTVRSKNIWYMADSNKEEWGRLSNQSIQHIILNISPPLLALYAQKIDNSSYMERALKVFTKLKVEDNKIIRKYVELGERPKSAYDTQAFLQLYSSYCQSKRCLNCKIGLAIMKHVS